MNRKRPQRVEVRDPRPTPRKERSTPREERRTLIPSFDPADLAREVEESIERPTSAPPFDPALYARILDEHVTSTSEIRDTPRTLTAVSAVAEDDEDVDVETMGREMYGSYLASEFPAALTLAERVLARDPDHALAQLVQMRCRARLGSESPTLHPSSVLRLKSSPEEFGEIALDPTSDLVLRHVDGVTDAASLAEKIHIPRAEAIDRLHELLELGVLEVVAEAG